MFPNPGFLKLFSFIISFIGAFLCNFYLASEGISLGSHFLVSVSFSFQFSFISLIVTYFLHLFYLHFHSLSGFFFLVLRFINSSLLFIIFLIYNLFSLIGMNFTFRFLLLYNSSMEKRLLARIYYLHPLVLCLFIIWFQHLLVFF